MHMRSSKQRLFARVLTLGLLGALAVGVVGAGAAPRAHHATPKQSNVYPQQQAVPGSGKGITIGYATSLEAVPIVHVISDGIKAQAKRAGVKLDLLRHGRRPAKALDCAKSMKTQGAQGVLQFQHVTKASPCNLQGRPAGGAGLRDRHPPAALPDVVHGRRQRLRRLRRRREGRPDGQGEWNCKYDAWVSLEEPEIGAPNDQRLGGYRKGFQSVCPGPITNLKKVGFDATLDKARTLVTDILTTLPGKTHIIVASIDDEGIEGAFAAAKAAGRPTDVWGISLGVADRSPRCGIKTNPNWLASTAIFPEKYGWTAIPAMIQAIKGKTLPKLLYIPLIAVNSKNIGKYYPNLSC